MVMDVFPPEQTVAGCIRQRADHFSSEEKRPSEKLVQGELRGEPS
jgi:hypothetical protein